MTHRVDEWAALLAEDTLELSLSQIESLRNVAVGVSVLEAVGAVWHLA